MLGVLLVQQGNSALYNEAEQCYKAAIELGYIGRSESNLGMIYMRQGELDHAKQWMELALQREEIPETLAALALLEARLGGSITISALNKQGIKTLTACASRSTARCRSSGAKLGRPAKQTGRRWQPPTRTICAQYAERQ